MDTDKIYQHIGEFVVSFQWLEHKFREIGWLIVDPKRSNWPPRSLRDDSNHDLINKVEKLFNDLIDTLDIGDAATRKDSFRSIVAECHALRKYRNNLLHSAFIELKAGGEAVGIMRSNPKLKFDVSSGVPLFDQEILSEDSISGQMEKLAKVVFSLNLHYVQLVHWAPYDRLQRTV